MDKASSFCQSAGCVHKTHGEPTWAAGANPFAAGDTAANLLREVCAQLEAVGCGACVGSMAPMEDLHGRIVRFLAGAPVAPSSLEVSQAAVEAFGRAVEALTKAHPNVNPWSYRALEVGIAAALAVHLAVAPLSVPAAGNDEVDMAIARLFGDGRNDDQKRAVVGFAQLIATAYYRRHGALRTPVTHVEGFMAKWGWLILSRCRDEFVADIRDLVAAGVQS